jgi:hypothetical protein
MSYSIANVRPVASAAAMTFRSTTSPEARLRGMSLRNRCTSTPSSP